jgi:hypothetical protein
VHRYGGVIGFGNEVTESASACCPKQDYRQFGASSPGGGLQRTPTFGRQARTSSFTSFLTIAARRPLLNPTHPVGMSEGVVIVRHDDAVGIPGEGKTKMVYCPRRTYV